MKFQLTMKDPDALHWAMQDALKEVDAENREAAKDEIEEIAYKFLSCGEYVTLEFNTALGTCMVVPKSR